MRRWLACAFVTLVCGWGGFGHAASVADLEQRLAGSTSRTWVFQRVVKSMGAVLGCTSGETYTFSADHQLIVSVCRNGKMADTKYRWSMTDTGSGDTTVTITGLGVYIVLFKDPPDGGHLMRLLVPNAPSQTTPVTDKEFSLDED